MIFYGTNGSHLHSEKVSNTKCNNCNEITPHTVSVYGRYTNIYLIPIFPLSKKVFSECDNCKITLEKKEMSEQLKLKANNIKRNTKNPLWYWSGMAFIFSVATYSFYTLYKHSQDVVTYVANPKKGDVIHYFPSDFYSTLKIDKVTNDSIFVIQNNYEIESLDAVDKIDKDKNYTSEPYGISKEEYKKLYDTGEVKDVIRR